MINVLVLRCGKEQAKLSGKWNRFKFWPVGIIYRSQNKWPFMKEMKPWSQSFRTITRRLPSHLVLPTSVFSSQFHSHILTFLLRGDFPRWIILRLPSTRQWTLHNSPNYRCTRRTFRNGFLSSFFEILSLLLTKLGAAVVCPPNSGKLRFTLLSSVHAGTIW